ncbi:RNA pyrophosphohydrolase [Sphingomonas histidinilytica]|uniref:RNA pyrophosphohydrolase n=1 Tax=Rhizorhabdus histidinilytica TaxID=439228 RepID=A0A1T5B164_9SPHN|nr:RNA pyrophosphohydrolase [Rhizorhabdus histidinilytica]MBO9377809.1 RNA pyrophosphohydrolase [Rhizorhabdus histidinilytica]QEH79481.1 RNA pyrophosphohydrolase [Sphingomonas sp. C8-2]SKB40720.1 putative (di)nucleoside polyphosphate hydrolase [Rhizorhabdus histidinilytica]
MKKTLPYRPAAAIMLLNAEDKVFVAQRIDSALEAWQMPQGGLDPDEEPQAGALRELQEETGIRPELVEILAKAPEVLFYDLPPELMGKIWGGRYRGQAQHWFVARFLGTDADVNLDTPEPEFRAWKWAEAGELVDLIVPFKRALYTRVIETFRDHLPR